MRTKTFIKFENCKQ